MTTVCIRLFTLFLRTGLLIFIYLMNMFALNCNCAIERDSYYLINELVILRQQVCVCDAAVE